MNEIDILKKLASNLTDRKSIAALNNYEVLCNNISFSHNLLEKGKTTLKHIFATIKLVLNKDSSLRPEYQKGNDLNSFTVLIPNLLSNGLEVIDKLSLHTPPDSRDNINIDNVGLLHKGFIEYNGLVTASRQLIDSLVTDSYQMQLLEPKEFNYHVFLSLNSFEKYATKSLRQGLFNGDVEDALTEFRKLKFNDWKNSAITKCKDSTFINKLDYLFSELNLVSLEDDIFKNEIKNLYKFSSEFTHIGYISTFFTSQLGSQPIFCDDKSPYLPSTENFSELKYQIIETCINFIFKLYVPSIKICVDKIILDETSKSIIGNLDNLISMLEHDINTRNNNYYFFVASSAIESEAPLKLPCNCGYTTSWNPPYNKKDLFCKGCGSSFNIMILEGNPDYISTSKGPAKVIGSTPSDFQDLSFE